MKHESVKGQRLKICAHNRVIIYNDHGQSTNQIRTFNLSATVTNITLTPGSLILTVEGDRTTKTSKLTLVLTDDADNPYNASENSVQTHSPKAYCDSINVYIGDTRTVNCHFFTKSKVTLGKHCLHVYQRPSQVTLFLYDLHGILLEEPVYNSKDQRDQSKARRHVVVHGTNPGVMSSLWFSYPTLKWDETRTDPRGLAWCQQVAMKNQTPREFDCCFESMEGC